MNKKRKRFSSWLLTFVMLVGLLPISTITVSASIPLTVETQRPTVVSGTTYTLGMKIVYYGGGSKGAEIGWHIAEENGTYREQISLKSGNYEKDKVYETSYTFPKAGTYRVRAYAVANGQTEMDKSYRTVSVTAPIVTDTPVVENKPFISISDIRIEGTSAHVSGSYMWADELHITVANLDTGVKIVPDGTKMGGNGTSFTGYIIPNLAPGGYRVAVRAIQRDSAGNIKADVWNQREFTISATDKRAKFISVAEGEIGTKETGNNINKYGEAYGWNGVAWCAQFVWWVGRESDVAIPKTASAAQIVYNMTEITRSQAKRGDIVVINLNSSRTYADHVGIFYSDSGGSNIDVLGGNQSNMVNVTPYRASTIRYYRPNFGENTQVNFSATANVEEEPQFELPPVDYFQALENISDSRWQQVLENHR